VQLDREPTRKAIQSAIQANWGGRPAEGVKSVVEEGQGKTFEKIVKTKLAGGQRHDRRKWAIAEPKVGSEL